MFQFFRRYQRTLFFVVSVVSILSLVFFGTFNALMQEKKTSDVRVAYALNGAPLMLSEVRALSYFLGERPIHLLNHQVMQEGFFSTGIIELLAGTYFDGLREEAQSRLYRAQQSRLYQHPETPLIGVETIWQAMHPSLYEQWQALKGEEEVSPRIFQRLIRLYEYQTQFPPELLRRVLQYRAQELSWLPPDPRLAQEDLSLLRFHTFSQWLGRPLVDLVSQFLLNAAAVAEQKGYQVTLEEARGDLFHSFQKSISQIPAQKEKPTFSEYLHSLGLEEGSAASLWRKVLLFRRYFQDVGQATFVDQLPFADFTRFSSETARVHKYESPYHLKSLQDLLEFEFYIQAVAHPPKQPGDLPSVYRSPEEVMQLYPELVKREFEVEVAQISKSEAALRASLKEVSQWQLAEENWEALRKELSSLPVKADLAQRKASLDNLSPEERGQLDRFARRQLVESHPEWIEESLARAPSQKQTIDVFGLGVKMPHVREGKALAKLLEQAAEKEEKTLESLKAYCDDREHVFRIVGVLQKSPLQVLSFERARGALPVLVNRHLEEEYPKLRGQMPEKFQKENGAWKALHQVRETFASLMLSDLFRSIDQLEKNQWKPGEGPAEYYATHRFLGCAQKAYEALQKDPNHALSSEYGFKRLECEIQRSSQEEWMKEQAFLLTPKQWSPVRVSDEGETFFFYVEERKNEEVPVLPRLVFGKEMLAADAQKYLAKGLIQQMRSRNAISFPIGKKEEE